MFTVSSPFCGICCCEPITIKQLTLPQAAPARAGDISGAAAAQSRAASRIHLGLRVIILLVGQRTRKVAGSADGDAPARSHGGPCAAPALPTEAGKGRCLWNQ